VTEEILTHEGKEAIRLYMIKLITLPGALLTVISFSMGFFVKDWAYQSAYNVAYSKALLCNFWRPVIYDVMCVR